MNLKLNNRQLFLISSALHFTQLNIQDLLNNPPDMPPEELKEFEKQMLETRELLEWIESAEATKNLEKIFKELK